MAETKRNAMALTGELARLGAESPVIKKHKRPPHVSKIHEDRPCCYRDDPKPEDIKKKNKGSKP